jgi:hypothetical protein
MQVILCRVLTPAFAALFASSLAATCLHAQSPQIERIDIFDVGIYCAETIDKIPEPNAPTGFRNVVSTYKFLKGTTKIPVQLGTRFGMRYTIVGNPSGATVPIRMVTRMPPPGVRDPKSGKTMQVSDYTLAGSLGANGYRDYQIEYDWEGVPGVWTFEFWDRDRKLVSQNFTLSFMTPAQQKSLGISSCAPVVSSIAAPATNWRD